MKISNTEINNLIDKYINKKDVFFRIYTGFDNNLQAEEVTGGEPETGLTKFKELILEIGSTSPDFIHIELFKSTAKSVSRKSFFQKTVKLKKHQNSYSVGNLGSFPEALGGMDAFLTAKVNAASTETKFESLMSSNLELKRKLDKAETIAESLKDKNEQQKELLSEKTAELNELKRTYDWDMKRLSEDKETSLKQADIERKSSDRLLTIGGQIAANIMGVNKEVLAGLFADGTFAQEQTSEHTSESKNSADVDFKPEFTGKKAEAAKFADELSTWMLNSIESNTEDNALILMKNIFYVNKYMASSADNVDILTEFINKSDENGNGNN